MDDHALDRPVPLISTNDNDPEHPEEEEIETAPPRYSGLDSTNYNEDVAKGGSLQTQQKQQNRLSAYSFVDLPEVVPPETFDGAHIVDDDVHKEVVPGSDAQVVASKQLPEVHDKGSKFSEAYDEEGSKYTVPLDLQPDYAGKPTSSHLQPKRKVLGVPLKRFIVGVASLVLMIIVLGVGLGVGLHHSSSSKTQYEPPSNAFHGSKLSMGPVSRTLGGEQDLVLYFQHETGDIRWMELVNGNWVGGNSSTQVALNAKAGTPISVVPYTWDGLDNWRVYYIDNSNTLQEVWQATQTWTQGWELGLLPNLGLKAWDDPNAGMVACWYGSTTPGAFSTEHANATDASEVLIRLIYAKDATTFQEIVWNANSQDWTMGQEITNIDASSSPACYNPQLDSTDYLMLVDQQQNVNVFWKDSSNTTNSAAHPANQWTNSSISIPNAGTAATLAWDLNLFAQDTTTNMIKGYNITFAAENTTVDLASAMSVQNEAGISQTGLAVTIIGEEYVIMYQTNETSISALTKIIPNDSAWRASGLYIPDT